MRQPCIVQFCGEMSYGAQHFIGKGYLFFEQIFVTVGAGRGDAHEKTAVEQQSRRRAYVKISHRLWRADAQAQQEIGIVVCAFCFRGAEKSVHDAVHGNRAAI